MKARRSRLAPSPTGSLHLGNASTLLINWAVARSKGWELVMRIEDLDGPRVKEGSIDQTITILQWLGIEWDGKTQLQSQSHRVHQEALNTLIRKDCVYHCNLSRKELERVTFAPHAKDAPISHGVRPSDIHQHNLDIKDSATNWRFVSQATPRTIHDRMYGSIEFQPNQDFIVWAHSGIPSYQLAVVVDDHEQGVTDVIRGNDLLQSSAWQEQLYEALQWDIPNWWHVPLIIGTDGRRLAKRHGDTRLASYRANGTSPDRIIGLVAKWCGILTEHTQMDASTFCTMLDLSLLPKEDIVFTHEDHKWLLE